MNLALLAMKTINVQNANSMWKVTNVQALLVAHLAALINGMILAESEPTLISAKNAVLLYAVPSGLLLWAATPAVTNGIN
jgi:hypothetical protein